MSSNELVGMHFSSLLFPSDLTRMLVQFEKVVNHKSRGFRLEHRITHKDGSIVWVATTFTGVRQNEEEGRLALSLVVENITEKKRIELEVIEIKNQLHRNLEMERLRLAQELHDGPMQELYSAIFQIDSFQNMLDPGYKDVLDRVKLDNTHLITKMDFFESVLSIVYIYIFSDSDTYTVTSNIPSILSALNNYSGEASASDNFSEYKIMSSADYVSD